MENESQAAPRVSSRIVGSIDDSRLVTLRGNVHPLASAANDRGAVAGDFPAERMVLVLKRSEAQESALQQFLQSVQNPASANYHQYLSPSQFGRRFGLPSGDLETLADWLRREGFTVAHTLSGGTGIEFSGSAAQVEAAFHTAIHSYVVAGEQHYANATDPQIPAALAGVVAGITMSDFAPRPLHTALGQAALDPLSHRATPLFNEPLPNVFGCLSGYCFAVVPGDFAAIYDTKPLLASGVDGSGVTIGVVGVSNIDTSIVKRFRQNFLPAYSATQLPNVILDGPDPGTDLGDATVEAYLDVEEAGAIAPNATIDFYTAANSYVANGLGLAFARALDENRVSVLSVSFGACEAFLGTTYNAFYNELFEQAAAQGMTVLVSSGDTGSAGCDPPYNTSGPAYAISGLFVSGLASSPYVVAVGGTDFLYPASVTLATLGQYWNTPTTDNPGNNADWSSAKGYIPEKPWNLSDPVLDQLNLSPQLQGAGGGKSSCIVYDGTLTPGLGANPAQCHGGYPQPEWQKGFTTDSVRDLPDLSLFASDGSNYSFTAVCTQSTDCAVPNAGPNSVAAPLQVTKLGGTSVAAPVMAGIMALVVQKTQSRQGQANSVIYPLSRQVPQAFHDVTQGTIAMGCVAGSYDCGADGFLTGYSAAAGYDLATGLGSVDAAVLVDHWSQVIFQPTTTTLTIAPTTAVHNTALTFTVNVTGGATSGDIALLTTSPGSGATGVNQGQYQTTCASFPCTFSYAGLPGGKYEVAARFAGSSVYAPSTSASTAVDITQETSQLGVYYQVGDSFSNGQVIHLNGQTDLLYGRIITFTAVPAPASIALPIDPSQLKSTPATGTVQVSDNGKPILTPLTLNANGMATLTDYDLTVGKHSLTAVYSGDASYGPSSTLAPLATPMNFTIIPTVSSLYLEPYYQQVLPGTGAQVTASISRAGPAPPTGTVTFSVITSKGTTVLPPVTLVYDPTTFTATAVGNIPASALEVDPPSTSEAGNNLVTANYSGDQNYQPVSQDTIASIYDVQVPTNVFLYTTPNAPVAGQSTAISARVGWSNILGISGFPNGNVTFLDGTTSLGTTATVADGNGNGTAVLTTSKLAVGPHTITANYSGNTQFSPSTATMTVTVAPAPPPVLDFTITATPITVPKGVSGATATSTLALQLNFAPGSVSTISLSCAPPPQASQIHCTVPATVTIPAGSAAATSTVTVTFAGQTAQVRPPALPGQGLGRGSTEGTVAAAGGIAALLLVPVCMQVRKKRWSRLAGALLLLCLGASLSGFLTGCQSLHYETVPAGNYSVTVTATLGSNSHQGIVPIRVQ